MSLPLRLAPLVSIALLACNAACGTKRAPPLARDDSASASTAVVSELDTQIAKGTQLANAPGDGSHERAMQYLVDHADVAEPRLLALITERRPCDMRSVAMVLARIGRPESVPVLEAVVARGEELVSGEAAMGLAAHPSPAARGALERALDGANEISVIAATDALGARRDRASCAALRPLLTRPSARVRYHGVESAVRAECIDSSALHEIASGDHDPEVRALATRLAKGGRP